MQIRIVLMAAMAVAWLAGPGVARADDVQEPGIGRPKMASC